MNLTHDIPQSNDGSATMVIGHGDRRALVAWLAGIGVVLALAATLTAIILQRSCACDDASITFRFADNLVAGWGLRWNETSPPCEGYTNFLHLLLIAGLRVLGLSPELAAICVSCAAVLGLVLLHVCLVPWRGIASPLVALPCVALLVDESLDVHASRGLETVLFAFLAVAFTAATQRTSRSTSLVWGVGTGLVGILLVLARPDGVLVIGGSLAVALLGNHFAKRSQRGCAATIVTIGIAMAAYAFWKVAYFGYLLPNAFYLKATRGGWPGVEPTLAYFTAYGWSLVSGVAVMAATLAFCRGNDSGKLVSAMTLTVMGAWSLYTMRIVHEIGFEHRFSWPMLPILAYGVASSLGLWVRETMQHRVIVAASSVSLLLIGVLVTDRMRDVCTRLAAPLPRDALSEQFERLGSLLRDTPAGRDLRLLCANAGITPYVARVHHIDPAGLTDDGFCGRTPIEERGRYLATIRPDVVVWHLPPASPGAKCLDTDPRLATSTYIRDWCLAAPDSMDEGSKVSLRGTALDRTASQIFEQAVFLRDFATLVGEMHCGLRRWRMFVYVMRSSPWHDELVPVLTSGVDIPSPEVAWDGWPDK